MQVIPDLHDNSLAVIMAFYKWQEMPILQLLMSMSRTRETHQVVYRSQEGIHIEASFICEAKNATSTEIKFSIKHGIPTLIEEWVGATAFECHMREIFTQNLEVCFWLCEPQDMCSAWRLPTFWVRTVGPKCATIDKPVMTLMHATDANVAYYIHISALGPLLLAVKCIRVCDSKAICTLGRCVAF
jgi:hypothetical protein